MDKMSETSSISYRKYFLKDKKFLKYFNTITPQRILDKLYIGSRPARRNKNQDIRNLRAIPWVFAWTQIRFILPSWLGTFEALKLASKGKNKKIEIHKW